MMMYVCIHYKKRTLVEHNHSEAKHFKVQTRPQVTDDEPIRLVDIMSIVCAEFQIGQKGTPVPQCNKSVRAECRVLRGKCLNVRCDDMRQNRYLGQNTE